MEPLIIEGAKKLFQKHKIEERTEEIFGMLDPKFETVFESCMIPNCSTMPTYDMPKRKERKSSKTKKREEMNKRERVVKKKVASAYTRRCESMLTRDDATLITEYEMKQGRVNPSTSTQTTDFSESDLYDSSTDTSETRDLNTLAEDTENAFKQKGMQKPESFRHAVLGKKSNFINQVNNQGTVISPVSTSTSFNKMNPVYTQSIRSKFEKMSTQKKFAQPIAVSPSSAKSRTVEDAMTDFALPNSSQRRSELAKQIMKRRQQMPTPASRTGVDP